MRAYTVGNPDVYEDAIDDPKGVSKSPGGAIFATARAAASALGLTATEDVAGRGRLPREWFPDRILPGKVYVVELPNGLNEDTIDCDYGFDARRLLVEAELSRLDPVEVE